jgi:hypothetical protein
MVIPRASVSNCLVLICAKDINVPIVSACDSGTHRGPRIGIKMQYHSCDFAPVSTVHIRVEEARIRDEMLPIARIKFTHSMP